MVKEVRAEMGMMWWVVGVVEIARTEVRGEIVYRVPSRVWGTLVWRRILSVG